MAKRLHHFLQSRLSSPSLISIENDEIAINGELGINNEDTRRLLGEFLAASPNLVGYSVSELDDLFTIGISQSLDKLVISCEICGYLAHDEDEMIIHKRVHGLFAP
ncbi:MAG: hypothetical protein ACREAQ_00955 [Nitrososphaera sp.]